MTEPKDTEERLDRALVVFLGQLNDRLFRPSGPHAGFDAPFHAIAMRLAQALVR
jgi:hypothetical protein